MLKHLQISKEEVMEKQFSHDMSDESERHEFEKLPDGWREFTILDCNESTSKSGNEMFIFVFEDKETGQKGDVYAISTQGKRWFLKQILGACEVEASADGVYDWDIEDVIGKEVQGLIKNATEEWIDREGEKQSALKPKVVQVKAIK